MAYRDGDDAQVIAGLRAELAALKATRKQEPQEPTYDEKTGREMLRILEGVAFGALALILIVGGMISIADGHHYRDGLIAIACGLALHAVVRRVVAGAWWWK